MLAPARRAVCCNGGPVVRDGTVPIRPPMNANLYALFERHFPDGAEQPCLADPGRAGHPLRRPRRDVGAHRARARRRRLPPGRPRRGAGRQALGGARALPRVPARRARLPAAQHRLPARRARLLLRRRRAARDRLPAGAPRASIAALAPDATVLTLGAGERHAARPRGGDRPTTFDTVASRAGRPRRDPLHVGHDRPLEGRDADPPQPRVATRWRWSRPGASRAATCCCTRCRSITCTACSSPCHCALLSGSRMLWLPKFDADEVAALLPRATVMMGVPTFYTRLLAEPSFDARATAASMRLFVSGSAPLLPETFDAFRERTGHTILERYGMTETGMNTSNPLDGERIARHRRPAAARRCRCASSSDDGAPCAAGERRRHRGQGPERVRRLLAHAGEDARGVHRRRLLPHRRHRRVSLARTGYLRHRRPREGPDHHRRPQRLSEGNRGAHRRAARRRRIAR